MPSNPNAQTVPGPYKRDQIQSIPPKMQSLAQADEVRALIAENAKLKQENARRRMKMQDMECEIDSLKATIRAMREGI